MMRFFQDVFIALLYYQLIAKFSTAAAWIRKHLGFFWQ